MAVALELGARRTFATALAWPGWARAGRDEEGALDALLTAGPRYATVLRGTVPFRSPRSLDGLEVVERIPGDATTDFGAPGTPPSADADAVSTRELARLTSILRACWIAFDAAADAARGHALRSGARHGDL